MSEKPVDPIDEGTDFPPEPPEVTEVLRGAEERLGLGEGFFERLDKLDDWTLVIVSATLVDTYIHRLLVSVLAPGEASGVVGSFLWKEMPANKRREFAVRLGLLSGWSESLARAIAQLRNHAAHEFRAINGFSIPSYFASLEANKRRSLSMDIFGKEVDGAAAVEPEIWNDFGRTYFVTSIKMLIAGVSLQEYGTRMKLATESPPPDGTKKG